MKIAVDFGHGTGQDRGAEGYLNEEKVVREYGALVITGLQKLGHTVINVTPVQGGLTLGQSLGYRVNVANNARVDLFVSCHLNAFKTDVAQGCEVEYISKAGKTYADKICTELSKLGFKNRGSQQRPNLYVLRYTDAVSVLIEPFFCDTKSDCDKYNAKKLANAIIKGITGEDVYGESPVVVTQPVPDEKIFDTSIPAGDNITRFNGGIGYIETIKDQGRVIVHLDRYTYISMQNEGGESHIDLFSRTENKRLI
ncbi:MAG: N-acetylmuramoyl-L-alanine amidase [Clostridiaceae bacterium]|nr:N-acetylmuramoyl-L-alanine amidase [Clostridiaceae bacterium]